MRPQRPSRPTAAVPNDPEAGTHHVR
jgi:hypothetical protein